MISVIWELRDMEQQNWPLQDEPPTLAIFTPELPPKLATL